MSDPETASILRNAAGARIQTRIDERRSLIDREVIQRRLKLNADRSQCRVVLARFQRRCSGNALTKQEAQIESLETERSRLLASKESEVEHLMQQFKSAVDALPMATPAFESPKNMVVGDALTIPVLVEVPVSELTQGLVRSFRILTDNVRVSDQITGVLESSSALGITPNTPQEGSPTPGLPVKWSWIVEAKAAGKDQPLNLKISALVTLPGTTNVRHPLVAEIDRKVTIAPKPRGWSEYLEAIGNAAKSLNGIIALLGASLGGLLWIYARAAVKRRLW